MQRVEPENMQREIDERLDWTGGIIIVSPVKYILCHPLPYIPIPRPACTVCKGEQMSKPEVHLLSTSILTVT